MLPLLVLLLLGQEPAHQPPPRFTSRSDLVVLHVSVLDGKKGFVGGLPRESFSVYQDGKPQEVVVFENTDAPVTVGLVLDSSISMHRLRKSVIAAGISFAESSRPDDEMFTVNFNENVWLGLPDGMPFTSDREVLRQALLSSTARGRTAVFDALLRALSQLEQGSRQKKFLILVSDGGDNASTARFEQVLDKALRMDAVIYTVSVRDEDNKEGKPAVLKKLASATGGEAFFLRDGSEVAATFERIARDIRSGYTIAYAPDRPLDGVGGAVHHAIRVDVRPVEGRRMTVRARSGYIAGGSR